VAEAPAAPDAGARSQAGGGREAADPERERVLGALGEDAMTMDDVIERTGIASGRAAALLLGLELSGRVRQVSGQRFVRVLQA
jgi:DNA processing protein